MYFNSTNKSFLFHYFENEQLPTLKFPLAPLLSSSSASQLQLQLHNLQSDYVIPLPEPDCKVSVGAATPKLKHRDCTWNSIHPMDRYTLIHLKA